MPEIYVDTDQLRWQARNLRVFLDSVRRAGSDIRTATLMAEGYEGQLRRQVMAIAGADEGLVRTLANDLEEMIQRLTQIVDAFEAADSIRESNPTLGGQMMRLIDGGMLLSSFPWEYFQASPRERRLWAHEMGLHGLALLGTDNRQLRAFAGSALLPAGGSEADYWNAFLIFLYVQGTIQTQPPLETWRSAAGAAGTNLAAYVATATGLREQNVDAWLRAAQTHETGAEAAIEEMVEMARAGETIEDRFGFTMEGNWSEGDQDDIVEAVLMVSHGMAAATAEADTAAEVFRSVFDGVEITLGTDGPPDTWYCTGHGGEVACTPRAYDRISPQTVAHELGHTFNARLENHLRTEIRAKLSAEDAAPLLEMVDRMSPYGELATQEIVARVDGGIIHVSGMSPDGGYERTDLGFASLGTPWQQHSLRWGHNDPSGNTANEDFADTFLGWAYDHFSNDAAGRARDIWISRHAAEWIQQASAPIDLTWFGDLAP